MTNPTKRQARRLRRSRYLEDGGPSSIVWLPGSTPKNATRWSKARPMLGPWESAMDQSVHPITCKPPSMPILASFSITRSQLSQPTIDCFIRWPLPPRMPSQSTRSPWLQTLATQMARTLPPARVKGLRHAFRQIVRLTIKATGRSSTDPPSSISLRVTPTHVRRAAGWYANRS